MTSIDRVYGVTMTQKGISDIVSVDFEKQIERSSLMKNDLSDRLEQKLKKSKTKLYKNNGYSIGLKISLDLVSSIIVGALIGLGLDKIFLTKPIFFIIFLVLGIIYRIL